MRGIVHNEQFLFFQAKFAGLLLIVYNISFGAFDHYPTHPSSVAAGILATNFQNDALGVLADPASVVLFHDRTFSFVSGNRFGQQLLHHQSAALLQKFNKYSFALNASKIGDEKYSETLWGFTVGQQLFEKMNFGVGVVYYGLSVKDYGFSNTLGLNIGWNILLDDKLSWHGSWRNVNNPQIGSSNEPLPQVLFSSIVFKANAAAMVMLEIEQDTDFESRKKFGIQYKLFPWSTIFIGHATAPDQTSGGLQIFYRHIDLSYAFTTHVYLDLSHWFGCGITFR